MFEEDEATANLAAGSVLSMAGDRHGVAVAGVVGKVWITQAGDETDYLLRARETWRSRHGGRGVKQSLTDAFVHVSSTHERPRPAAVLPLAGATASRY